MGLGLGLAFGFGFGLGLEPGFPPLCVAADAPSQLTDTALLREGLGLRVRR